MLLYSVRETLMRWNRSFVGKKDKMKFRDQALVYSIHKARSKIAFEGNVLSIQRLKGSFVSFFDWTPRCFHQLCGFALRMELFLVQPF